jgi:probable rRNA maturation factor
MIFVDITESFSEKVESSLIKRTVKTTLAHLSVPEDASLTVVLTDDQQIRELNRKYRKIDTSTDVLSFPAGYVDPEDGNTYLGDVVISYPKTVIQAERRGHSIEDELQLLVVHGTLHLLGYDHAEPVDKENMWSIQGEILLQLGIKNSMMHDV